MIKAVLIDFDGTIVTNDMLDVVCGIVGKEDESREINKDFHEGKLTGLDPLISRINFLKGVTLTQIYKKLNEGTYLMPGAENLFNYLNNANITSILHSGNIIPILSFYQRKLNITHIVGTKPQMNGDQIVGISEEDFSGKDFKIIGVNKILNSLKISPGESIAIGDSPADKAMFHLAGKSIAINPKNHIEKYANFTIKNDLTEAMKIIQDLNLE